MNECKEGSFYCYDLILWRSVTFRLQHPNLQSIRRSHVFYCSIHWRCVGEYGDWGEDSTQFSDALEFWECLFFTDESMQTKHTA